MARPIRLSGSPIPSLCLHRGFIGHNLTRRHSVAPERIFYLNYTLPLASSDPIDKSAVRRSFFEKFGISIEKFSVVGMGTATY